jgi:hypothetical protein
MTNISHVPTPGIKSKNLAAITELLPSPMLYRAGFHFLRRSFPAAPRKMRPPVLLRITLRRASR